MTLKPTRKSSTIVAKKNGRVRLIRSSWELLANS
jgi:hypothetical protein